MDDETQEMLDILRRLLIWWSTSPADELATSLELGRLMDEVEIIVKRHEGRTS